MTIGFSINEYLMRHPKVAGMVYIGIIVICCLTTLSMVTDIADGYRIRSAALETLSRLEGRKPSSDNALKDPRRSASPFLEGQTVTVASAALLQRVTGIITKAGGTVVSSEMAQQGAQSKNDYLTAIANCELDQEGLQKVLFEIEAGLPSLFIDRMDAQAAADRSQDGRLRVQLAVTGLWRGGRK